MQLSTANPVPFQEIPLPFAYSEETERRPSVAATIKFRWRATTDFVLTIAFIADALVIFTALCLGFWVRFDSGLIPMFSDVKSTPVFFDYFYLLIMGTAFLLGTFVYLQLYDRRCLMQYPQTATLVVKGAVFWLFEYLAVSLILKFDPPISRLFMVSSFVCLLSAMLAWRRIFFKIIHWEVLATNLRQRVLFVGWGNEAEQLETEIRDDYLHPYTVIGCVPSPQGRLHHPPPPSVPVLGDYQNLSTLLERRSADIVILADLDGPMSDIAKLVNLCEMEFAQFKVIPPAFKFLLPACGWKRSGAFRFSA
jgi:FlaA1/EpsC-like NDP-sugar epimerase